VLALLDSLRPGDHVSPRTNAPNNIVTKFLKLSQSRRFRDKRKLEAAIKRLYDSKTIKTVEEGPPSRRTYRVARTLTIVPK
jgi:hypothetical protein